MAARDAHHTAEICNKEEAHQGELQKIREDQQNRLGGRSDFIISAPFLERGLALVITLFTLSVCPQIHFWMKAPVWLDQLYSNSTCLPPRHSGTTIDFGVKRATVRVTGQGSLCLPTNLFLDDNSCLE